MKKLILLTALLISTVVSMNAQSLKGFTLGEKLTGSETEHTTVAGIKGVITASTLNDGRIYALSFIPSEDGKNVSRIYNSDLDRLVKGVEKQYDVTFKTLKREYEDFVGIYYTKDKSFMISVDENEFMDVPVDMVFYITDPDLSKIADKEEQEKANADF